MSQPLHNPIMVGEILRFMQDIPQGVNHYLDGTFGRGGHLRAVFNAFPGVRAVAIDKDLEAISFAKLNFGSQLEAGQLVLIHADYKEVANLVKTSKISQGSFDAILLDLGVSSPQLDSAERGFSFLKPGPLDMRMNQNQPFSAKNLINESSEEDLIEIFQTLGEIPSPKRVVRAIVQDRETQPFQTTEQLASLIARVEGWKKAGFHPATQYFMALRIRVNEELEGLATSIRELMELLEENGRLLVLTFHSLEDRIVKRAFLESAELGFPVNKRVVVAGDEEVLSNPRSRSAKLRVFERKTGVPASRAKKDKYADKKGQ